MKNQQVFYSTLKSPIGEIIVTADEQGITSIYSPTRETIITPLENAKRHDKKLRDATDQLRAYFAGDLHEFSLTLNPQGTTFSNKYGNSLKQSRTEQQYPIANWQCKSASRAPAEQ